MVFSPRTERELARSLVPLRSVDLRAGLEMSQTVIFGLLLERIAAREVITGVTFLQGVTNFQTIRDVFIRIARTTDFMGRWKSAHSLLPSRARLWCAMFEGRLIMDFDSFPRMLHRICRHCCKYISLLGEWLGFREGNIADIFCELFEDCKFRGDIWRR